MELKALVFAYCPTCRGVTLVIDIYDNLQKLGSGDVIQDCVFHSAEIKTVAFVCRKCKTKTAIARFPMIYDVKGLIDLLNHVKNRLDKVKDRSVELTVWASMEGVKVPETFWERSKKVDAELHEMRRLLGAIEAYRFYPGTQHTYYGGGAWETV